MPLQIIDYSKAPLLDSPAKSIFENVLKGYQMSQEPAKMKQEANAREMANALRKLEVEHKPKEYELNDQGKSFANALQAKALSHYDEKYGLDKQLKLAQIQRAQQAGMGAGLKPNGAVANAKFIYDLKKSGADPELIESLDTAFKTGMEHTQAVTERSKDVSSGNSFDKLPVNDKKQTVALYKGMGVDPVEAVSLLRKGVSPTQYAKENDIDISEVEPDYAAGEQNIKEAQQAEAYIKELDSFEEHINKGLGEYQNKIMGYSFDQIAESANGKNTDKVAKALAARALQPELNALRLKVMKANVGIEALRELESKSLGGLNVIEPLVDKKTYAATQKYMKDWIEEAGMRRIKALKGFSMLKTKLQKGAEKESSMGNDPLGLF